MNRAPMHAPIVRYHESIVVGLPPIPTRLGVLGLLAMAGCVTRDPPKYPLDPVPLVEAAAIVNANISAIPGTLRATGSVDGRFVMPEGGTRTYHADGVLFYRAPSFFRFDLKSFGDTQMLLGSNAKDYWCYSKADEATVCGRHGVAEDLPVGIPARPDQLIHALGLTPIPVAGAPAPPSLVAGASENVRVVQRVVDNVQQLLFLVQDDEGRVLIEKEYWVDRLAPYLVRRVVFRNGHGAVEMESVLDDYRALKGSDLQLAHQMTADWPGIGAQMRFDIRQWSAHPQIGPTAVQFATPAECRRAEGSVGYDR